MLDEWKIGFRLTGFRDRRLEESLKVLSGIGYDGVEICLEHPDLDPDNPARVRGPDLRQLLIDNGMEASAVSFHGKRATFSEKYRKCEAGVRLAYELGVRTFISGSTLDKSRAGRGKFLQYVKDGCDAAGGYNIKFAVEPEPDNLIENSREMRILTEEAERENLTINLDLGHAFLTEDDIRTDIFGWKDRIAHIHLEDMRSDEHRHLIPGEGDMDFRGIFRSLGEVKYGGFITLDIFDIRDNPAYHAERAYNSIAEVYK